jgi:hypothetical protein
MLIISPEFLNPRRYSSGWITTVDDGVALHYLSNVGSERPTSLCGIDSFTNEAHFDFDSITSLIRGDCPACREIMLGYLSGDGADGPETSEELGRPLCDPIIYSGMPVYYKVWHEPSRNGTIRIFGPGVAEFSRRHPRLQRQAFNLLRLVECGHPDPVFWCLTTLPGGYYYRAEPYFRLANPGEIPPGIPWS